MAKEQLLDKIVLKWLQHESTQNLHPWQTEHITIANTTWPPLTYFATKQPFIFLNPNMVIHTCTHTHTCTHAHTHMHTCAHAHAHIYRQPKPTLPLNAIYFAIKQPCIFLNPNNTHTHTYIYRQPKPTWVMRNCL